MSDGTDEATIREMFETDHHPYQDDDHPTLHDHAPAIDSEPTVEDPTFWPLWSSTTMGTLGGFPYPPPRRDRRR